MYFLVLTIKSRFRVCIVNRGDRTLSCRADELVRPYLARLSAFRDMKRRWFEGLCGKCDEVVGQSDLSGDANFHAFRWTKEAGIEDLGKLTGDVNSAALGINDSGEIVGLSLDANFDPHPYLWQNGVMTGLNSLIPADSPLSLLIACSINSSGEIVGLAVTSTGEVHGCLATPSNMAAGSEVLSPAAQGATGPTALPDHDRQMPVPRWRGEDVKARLEATLKRGTNVDAKDDHGTPLIYCAVVGSLGYSPCRACASTTALRPDRSRETPFP
jgi:probable HAF family extracellular repeat protein